VPASLQMQHLNRVWAVKLLLAACMVGICVLPEFVTLGGGGSVLITAWLPVSAPGL